MSTRHTAWQPLFVVIALGACAPSAVPSAVPETTSTQTSPLLDALPPEAVDIDPADNVLHVVLRAEQRDDGSYTYNGVSPGPTLRMQRGDRVIVDLENALDDPTTIHWHGLHVPFDMDGVTWMRDPVQPGETFRYTFTVEQAGTYWYHPHFDTEHQVDRGLYGAFVVEDPADPPVDHDVVLFVDAAAESGPELPNQAHGHGRINTPWTVNGTAHPTLAFAGGSRVRARMINASNAGYVSLRYPELRQIASDQGVLPAPITPASVLLAPGDRADFEWSIGSDTFVLTTADYSLNGGLTEFHPAQDLLTVAVETDAVDPPTDPPTPPPPLGDWRGPTEPVTPDPGYADIVYVFQGSDRTGEWRINGERFPNVTIEQVPFGASVVIELRNLSPTEHPFHLHGLSFEVLSRNGEPPAYRTLEDTINVRIRETVRIRVTATNAGDWMAHCHILPHAGDGMMTVLRVGAP